MLDPFSLFIGVGIGFVLGLLVPLMYPNKKSDNKRSGVFITQSGEIKQLPKNQRNHI